MNVSLPVRPPAGQRRRILSAVVRGALGRSPAPLPEPFRPAIGTRIAEATRPSVVAACRDLRGS